MTDGENNGQVPEQLVAGDAAAAAATVSNPSPTITTDAADAAHSDDNAAPRDFGSPPAAYADLDDGLDTDAASSMSTFPVASTIQPRPRLQRSSIPPPIDTENATKDADSTLRTRLLSTLSPSSSNADQSPSDALEPLQVSTSDSPADQPAPANQVDAGHQPNGNDQDECAHIGVSFSKNRRYRRTMEDAHYYKYDFDGVKGQCFMAIFDGHAGRQAAQWCGDNFSEVFLELKAENPDRPVPELLNLAFVEADRRLATDVKTHSGCTAVVAYLEIRSVSSDKGTDVVDAPKRQQRTLYCANAGDARAVLSRSGAATRLTYDHKGDDLREIERISESGGYVFNGRVNAPLTLGILAVTRALGDSSLKQYVIGNPYTTETILEDSDDVLILACDGLWDVCSDQEAVDLIRTETDPTHASQALLDYALSNESMDNITTMVFRIPPPPTTTTAATATEPTTS
ncbi:phosphatase 2C [Coemansia interrupta]|uniref:Phosphatase 2C n=1 Tax=Coemansia interrupta TaxID=1126814 RepID=A0A9W8HHX0_9FUNG|nr:phosphatase 2C [Coemansia interrupta]